MPMRAARFPAWFGARASLRSARCARARRTCRWWPTCTRGGARDLSGARVHGGARVARRNTAPDPAVAAVVPDRAFVDARGAARIACARGRDRGAGVVRPHCGIPVAFVAARPRSIGRARLELGGGPPGEGARESMGRADAARDA